MITEENKFFNRCDKVRFSFCTLAFKHNNFLIDAFFGKTCIIKSYVYLSSRSCGKRAVCFIFRSTNSHPDTICIGSCHCVCTRECDIAVSICFTNNNGDESFYCVAFDNSVVIVCVCINTDTVSVNVNSTAFNCYTLNCAESKTALRFSYSYVFDCKVPAGCVLEEGVESCTCAIFDYYAVRRFQTDSNSIAIACSCERASLNSKSGVVVCFCRCDKITTCISNKVDTLDCDSSVIVSIGKSFNGNSTIHLFAVTIDCVVETCFFCESYVFSNIYKKSDCLTILNCIDSSLNGFILSITDLCNTTYKNDLAVNNLSIKIIIVNDTKLACKFGQISSEVCKLACCHIGCIDNDVSLSNATNSNYCILLNDKSTCSKIRTGEFTCNFICCIFNNDSTGVLSIGACSYSAVYNRTILNNHCATVFNLSGCTNVYVGIIEYNLTIRNTKYEMASSSKYAIFKIEVYSCSSRLFFECELTSGFKNTISNIEGKCTACRLAATAIR